MRLVCGHNTAVAGVVLNDLLIAQLSFLRWRRRVRFVVTPPRVGKEAGRKAYLDIIERAVVNGSADGVYADCYGQYGLTCKGSECTAKRNGKVQSYNDQVTEQQVVRPCNLLPGCFGGRGAGFLCLCLTPFWVQSLHGQLVPSDL